MRNILMLLVAALFVTTGTYAQTKKELKEQQKVEKLKEKDLEKQMKAKSVKDARKEAKSLSKQGFSSSAGALPIDKQVENSWKYQYEKGADGLPAYFISAQTVVGGNHSAAQTNAAAQSRDDIASQIAAEVSSTILTKQSNQQLSASEAESIINVTKSSLQKIQQSLGRTIPVMEIYRKTPKGAIEMKSVIAYPASDARAIARKVVLAELDKLSDDLVSAAEVVL